MNTIIYTTPQLCNPERHIMAKKPTINATVTNFLKITPEYFSALHYGAYTKLARLISDDAINEMITVMADNDVNMDRDQVRAGLQEYFIETDLFFQRLARDRTYKNYGKVSKGNGSYSYIIHPEDRGAIGFTASRSTLPFQSYYTSRMGKAEKLKVLQVALKAVGIDFAIQDGVQIVTTPLVEDAVTYGYNLGQPTLSGRMTEVQVQQKEGMTFNNSFYKCNLMYEITVDGEDFDLEVWIKPMYSLTISADLISQLVETENKATVPYLLKLWGDRAIIHFMNRSSAKSWEHRRVVDPRETANKIDTLSRQFKAGSPRVNPNGFSISSKGLPILLPQVSMLKEYTDHISTSKPDEKGYYNFEENSLQWANKVLLVDWLNDIMVYTDSRGDIDTMSLLGFQKLDSNSEYVFLNSAVTEAGPREVFKMLSQLLDKAVTPEEAQAQIPTTSDVVISPSDSAMSVLTKLTSPLVGVLASADPGYRHMDNVTIRFKHLVGLDLNELGESNEGHKRLCAITQAYLKAAGQSLTRKDAEINLPIERLLEGSQYLMFMARSNPDKYTQLRENVKVEREKRKQQPLLAEIDIPNLDAGPNGNLKGLLPHQVQIASNMMAAPSAASHEVATGGGKSILSLISNIVSLVKDPKSRVMIITKPRLVKNTISEINYFTGGKINAVPLRRKQLRMMKRFPGIKTAAEFFKWVQSLPTNTIFVCSYVDFGQAGDVYDDLDLPKTLLDKDIGLTQFQYLLRLLQFKTVFLDESHIIKNINSNRAAATYSVTAYAENRQLATGTSTSNTVIDLVGQGFAINPMTYTNSPDTFMEKFGLESAIIKDDETAGNIKRRMGMFAQHNTAYKEDWAFVNPDLQEKILLTKASTLQTEFYNILLQEAQLQLEAMLKGKTVKAVDDDGEITDEELTAEDFDDDEGMMIAMAQVTLSKAEQFLLAPDTNEQYLSWEKKPTGNDLISPAVALIDTTLAKLYADPNADYSKKKFAIFGIHKVVSKHFMKHSRFKNRMVHYTSGDEEAIRMFKTKADIWGLCADSTSLREGENLQCVPGDTMVFVDKNTVMRMDEIYNDPTITTALGYDFKTGKIGPQTITRKMRQELKPTDDVYRITYKDEETGKKATMHVTGDHTMILEGNVEIPAHKTKIGDRMYTYGGKFDIVSRVNGELVGSKDFKSATSAKGAYALLNRRNVEEGFDTHLRERISEGVISAFTEDPTISKRAGRTWSAQHAVNMQDADYKEAYSQLRSDASTKTARNKARQQSKMFSVKNHRLDILEHGILEVYSRKGYYLMVKQLVNKLEKYPESFKLAQLRYLDRFHQELIDYKSMSNKISWKSTGRKNTKTFKRKATQKIKDLFASWSITKHEARIRRNGLHVAYEKTDYKYYVKQLLVAMGDRPRLFTPQQKAYSEVLKDELRRVKSKIRSNATKAVWESYSDEEREERLSLALYNLNNGLLNVPEQQVDNACIDNLDYTGDGSFWVRFKDGSCKNPDFVRVIRNGKTKQRKVVEVVGNRKFTKRHAKHDRELILKYSEIGVDCLIVNAEDCADPSTHEAIDRFVNNHFVTVTRVNKLSAQKPREASFGKYKYDISVDNTHNFFIAAKCSGSEPNVVWSGKGHVPVLLHNCLDFIFTVQPPWAPGDDEQLKSRMYRPDPKGLYNKELVTQYWPLIERADGKPGIGQVKLTRMISKAISVARLKYNENPLWKKVSPELDNLDLIKMKLEFLFGSEKADLAPYEHAWGTFNTWTRGLNRASRLKLAHKIELENPNVKIIDQDGKIIDRVLFSRLAMREVKSTTMLPGSKKVYVPWEPGATPADPYKLGLNIIGGDTLNVGDPVWTEYGPGIIMKAGIGKCTIELQGLKKVTLHRLRIAVPSKAKRPELLKIISDPALWKREVLFAKDQLAMLPALDPSGSIAPNVSKGSKVGIKAKPKVTEVDADEVDVEDLEDEDLGDLDLDDLDIQTYLVNMTPALVIIEDVPSLIDRGWTKMAPFISLKFQSWKVCESFIDLLEKKFYMSDETITDLDNEISLLKSGRALRLGKPIKQNEMRQFFREDHKRLPARRGMEEANPYFLTVGDDIQLVFSRDAHAPAVLSYIKRMVTKNAGKVKLSMRESMYVWHFNSFRAGMVEVRAIGKKFNLDAEAIKQELLELKADLQQMRKPVKQPKALGTK